MLPLFAQVGVAGSIASWVVVLIVIAAVLGIGMVALRAANVSIPPWASQIVWIVVIAGLAIVAIRFLLGMVGAF